MVKIVSKENINLIERSKIVDQKKELIHLNELARPPAPAKKPKLKIPSNRNIIKPESKKIDTQEILALMKANEPKYTEYKDSLDRIAVSVMASSEPDNDLCSSLKEKLSKSNDIKTIMKNLLFRHLEIENEFCVLASTVLTYWVENRLNIT